MLRKLEYTRQTKETLAANLRNMKKLVFDDTNFEKIYTESREKRYLFQNVLIQTKLFGEGCLVFPVLKEEVTDLPKLS